MDVVANMILHENYQGPDMRLLVDSCQGGEFFLDLNESTTGRTRFRGKFQEAEAVNKNKRMYPFATLDENVKRLNETIDSGGLIGELDHPCSHDPNFDVLTTYGWKEFKEIREGDTVFSRVGGRMVPSRVTAIIDQPYDGPVIRVKGRAIDCTFTPAHKFVLCERDDHRTRAGEQSYSRIDEIHADRTKFRHSYIPKTAKWTGQACSTIKLKSVDRKRSTWEDIEIDTMKFVGFLGLFLAEGCLKNTNQVEITQFSEYGKAIVRDILSDFHPDIEWEESQRGFVTSDARLYDYLVPLGNKYAKYIPAEIKALDPVFLERLIVAFAIGDGRIQKSYDGGKTCVNHKESLVMGNQGSSESYEPDSWGGCERPEISYRLDNGHFTRMSVFSVSEKLVDDLHECLVKCGGCGSRTTVVGDKDYTYAGRTIRAENKKPLHCLNMSRSKGIHMDPRFLKTIEGRHQGRIYCLTTEHGNFYMKYKGHSFWTGNSDSIIHFATASHKINKLWWDGNTLMGEGEILNTPHGKVLKALISDGVRVGISSRGVGNGKVNEEGILVIGESYKLITFDAVADPSTHQAFQKEVGGRKKESSQPNIPETVKNESSSIHKVSKAQLLACFGGILLSQTNELKARLNNGQDS